MSTHRVLDSYALIAFFENQSGADRVGEMMKQARDTGKDLLLSVVNWGEIYYILHRSAGQSAAELALQGIDTLPIEVVPADQELTRLAAQFKVSKRMSCADCFAAALAKTKKADLVTGDKAFQSVADQINLVWI